MPNTEKQTANSCHFISSSNID